MAFPIPSTPQQWTGLTLWTKTRTACLNTPVGLFKHLVGRGNGRLHPKRMTNIESPILEFSSNLRHSGARLHFNVENWIFNVGYCRFSTACYALLLKKRVQLSLPLVINGQRITPSALEDPLFAIIQLSGFPVRLPRDTGYLR